MMTFNDIKKKVWARLQDGTGKARAHGMCVYRSPEGKACAVGVLISDSAYTSLCEGTRIDHLGVTDEGAWWAPWHNESDRALAQCLNDSGVPASKEILNFLTAAQAAHDTSSNWDNNKFIGVLPE